MTLKRELSKLGFYLVDDNIRGYKILNSNGESVTDYNFKRIYEDFETYNIFKVDDDMAEKIGELIYEWNKRKTMVRILENKVELVKENLSYDEVLSKIEQATRLCYRSKRSETREGREKFLKNLMAVGHGSIIEHGSLSFLVTTDRACANQIVRHRIASYSQESSRYVDLSDLEIVLDHSYGEEDKGFIEFNCEYLADVYKELGGDKKSTRDKARAILPQCTATRLYMTMNFREIRHFLKLRLDKSAHQSIREIAYQILKIMKEEYPVFVFDFDIKDYEDIYE